MHTKGKMFFNLAKKFSATIADKEVLWYNTITMTREESSVASIAEPLQSPQQQCFAAQTRARERTDEKSWHCHLNPPTGSLYEVYRVLRCTGKQAPRCYDIFEGLFFVVNCEIIEKILDLRLFGVALLFLLWYYSFMADN